MRIEARAPVSSSAAARAKSPSGARFTLEAPSSATSSAAVRGTSAPMGLDAVLALQADSDEASQRRRRNAAARRGHSILDGLDRLKIALLGGRVSPERLAALKHEIAMAAGASGDPALDDLIAQIELRAQVELAKLAR